ncbi:hypothetical protein ACFL6U_32475 [Planctomycetota bacterium]
MSKKGSGFRVQDLKLFEKAFRLNYSDLTTSQLRVNKIHPALGNTEPRTLNPDYLRGGMQ